MIHTFTLKYQINANEYWKFKNSAHTKSYRTSQYKLENRLLEELGIVLYACKYKVHNKPDHFCYEMFVNPTKVLGRKDVVEIYKADMFEQFQEQFNHIIQEFEVTLPKLNEWTAKRIDFTKDIKTEHVKLYVKLFQKANLKGYWFPKDKNNNVVRFRPGSLYCRIGNHGINFYDKQDEMINQMREGKRFYTSDELKQAENVLRIEVQCSKSKLLSFKGKYELKDRNILPFLQREDIANETIKYYVKKILGTAPYYKKPGAELKIRRSGYTKGMKDRMIAFMNEVSIQYSSIDKVAAEYKNVSSLLKRFEDISVSPITINKNTTTVSEKLDSLYDLI